MQEFTFFGRTATTQLHKLTNYEHIPGKQILVDRVEEIHFEGELSRTRRALLESPGGHLDSALLVAQGL